MVSQKVILRGTMGYLAGICIGLIGAGVATIISPINIWFKIFGVIGLFSASLGTLYSLYETHKQYKLLMSVEEIKEEDIKELLKKEVKKQNGSVTKTQE